MADIPPHEQALAQHIIVSAFESPCEWDGTVPDDADFDWDEWTIEFVDGYDDGHIEVGASQSFTESTRVSRGSQTHPPEYENHDGTLYATFVADWSENALAGEFHIHFECEGGAPSPPDPEPYDELR
ncbi:hypothetical protein PN419_00545 [Halorubrum ezzemoulense]|uniref:hypothetical protein n=1 Tax=Halorubrum ezzemoulense TaxID=337243 RepID=UPI00233008D6|nr:hypothetical protein [Halorubrum ezzemoulense]MDB9247496.1 hypothetical protein [Halorubrum ezzemoulense]MDB9258595.1 hypothetical protein [Halorubrum ezzemoulense]MDB9264546.1 hypothetical protein [Halorubrum ezzemoulense]MDB9268956.1 hypothetical protein [Halorubrum ezzemoulense]MDB9271514.1 hypothetical protein [Halorubrum ezzemoulense]